MLENERQFEKTEVMSKKSMANMPLPRDSTTTKRSREDKWSEDGDHKKLKIDIVPMQLIEINDDCLAAVFQHLELKDMFSMASADSRFIPSLRLAFSQCHRKKVLVVSSHNDPITVETDSIKIPKKMSIKFLEYFGPHIVNLTVNGIWFATDIENALFKYCAESVVNLKLISSAWYGINKPFKNVKSLVLKDCVLGQKMSRLIKWFPNVIALDLKTTIVLQPKLLAAHFPKIENLGFYGSNKIPAAIIGKMLQFNPQLKVLVLNQGYSVDFLRSVNEYLPQLKSLWLEVPEDRFENFDDQTIHFKNVKNLLFTQNKTGQTGVFVVNMPLKFTNLNKLFLHGTTHFDGHILSFIKQNTNLNELLLWTIKDGLMYDELIAIVKSLPKLCRLKIIGDNFTEDNRLELVHECHRTSVTQLYMAFKKSSKVQAFRKSIETQIKYKWNVIELPTPTELIILRFDKL